MYSDQFKCAVAEVYCTFFVSLSNLFTFSPHPLFFSPLQLSLAEGNGDALLKANSVILLFVRCALMMKFPITSCKFQKGMSDLQRRPKDKNTQHSCQNRTPIRLASWCPFKLGLIFVGCQARAALFDRPLGALQEAFIVKNVMWFKPAVAPLFL